MKNKSNINNNNNKQKKETFDNKEKFEEHNRQLMIESKTFNLITEIHEFLDSYYDIDKNKDFLIPPPLDPIVLARTLFHFNSKGWKISREISGSMIKLSFEPV